MMDSDPMNMQLAVVRDIYMTNPDIDNLTEVTKYGVKLKTGGVLVYQPAAIYVGQGISVMSLSNQQINQALGTFLPDERMNPLVEQAGRRIGQRRCTVLSKTRITTFSFLRLVSALASDITRRAWNYQGKERGRCQGRLYKPDRTDGTVQRSFRGGGYEGEYQSS